ncbi:MAG: tRNA pseudouridine(55) synthase TruB [bacterium]
MPDETAIVPMFGRAEFDADKATFLQSLNMTDGALLLVDKPYGFTSFNLVNRLKHILQRFSGDKWVKVGHGGTLDPLATGLLIIATRRATRSLTQLLGLEKTYWCELRLGITTPSFDLETPITIVGISDGVTAAIVETAVLGLVGEQLQTPPMYSAVKLRGKPMYEHARKGRQIEIAAKQITIHSISDVHISLPIVSFRIRCTKGTYIRSIVADLGTKLGCGAVLINLRRELIGEYDVKDAISAEQLDSLSEPGVTQ